MEKYERTQIGRLMILLLGGGAVLCLCLGIVYSEPVVLAVFAVLALCFILFPTLTVIVDDRALEIRYGIGLIRKEIPLDEIESSRSVRNRWWYGLGIKRMPRGWLYNVGGLDAIELVMKNGNIYRIGTNDPRNLGEFLEAKLKKEERPQAETSGSI